jgi:hypothetical protein
VILMRTRRAFWPINCQYALHKKASPGNSGAFLLNNWSKWLFSAKKPLAFQVISPEFRANGADRNRRHSAVS